MNNFGLKFHHLGMATDNLKLSMNLLKKAGYKKTLIQLNKWGLTYHKLFINKPSSDIYIDDKAYGYNMKWKKEFKKYL